MRFSWRHLLRRQHGLPVALWLLLPLTVFCLARSRLTLYLLPLFVPLALLIAQRRQADGRGMPRWPWLLVWFGLLLALRLAAAWWPTVSATARCFWPATRRTCGCPTPVTA